MRLGALLAIAFALAPTLARAEPAEVVALTYRAPATCPDERAFVDAVRARTARASFAGEGTRRFTVLLEKRADVFHGRLSVGDGVRDLTSPRCEDLFDAFVLFVAIAVDPEGPAPPIEAPPPPPAEPAPLPSPPRLAPARRRTNAAPRRAAWHLTAGSGAATAMGIAEHALVSAHPFVDYSSDAIGASPGVRLGVLWANGDAQAAPGNADAHLVLGLRALALSGCALRFQTFLAGPAVRVCGELEGGMLRVRPFAIANPTAPDRPWFAAGPLLRVEMPLVPRLSLGAEVGALFPFERERVFARGNAAGALVSPVGARLAVVMTLSVF